METVLRGSAFSSIAAGDKEFIALFDEAMLACGYDAGEGFTDGFCWGRLMLIYRRTGAKSKHVVARVYVRDSDIALRLFLCDIDAHRSDIEIAPSYIVEAFTNSHGLCLHCKNEKSGVCRFRKSYTLFGTAYEKCSGHTFLFPAPDVRQIPDFIAIISAFYGKARNRKGTGYQSRG